MFIIVNYSYKLFGSRKHEFSCTTQEYSLSNIFLTFCWWLDSSLTLFDCATVSVPIALNHYMLYFVMFFVDFGRSLLHRKGLNHGPRAPEQNSEANLTSECAPKQQTWAEGQSGGFVFAFVKKTYWLWDAHRDPSVQYLGKMHYCLVYVSTIDLGYLSGCIASKPKNL